MMPRRSRWAGALVIAAALALAPTATAEPRLRVKRAREVPIVLVGGLTYGLVSGLATDALTPARCRWCAANPLDVGVRDGLRWSSPATADTASDVTAYVAAPAVALGLTYLALADGGAGQALDDGLVVAEAALLAMATSYTVKSLVGRERPDVHALAPADKPDASANNRSFYSGHSTLATSLVVAAGTVATMRGYRHARLVWAVGVPVAVATGYLRIAADKHWASDVVIGWATGAAIGAGVPWLLHRVDVPTPVIGRARGATTVGVALAW
ncbi:MAG: phosphatase PAP2 family protein [Myxococcales bacterium]|nr:phosphatase PAP2 family protein [Myxococcales bacterium]